MLPGQKCATQTPSCSRLLCRQGLVGILLAVFRAAGWLYRYKRSVKSGAARTTARRAPRSTRSAEFRAAHASPERVHASSRGAQGVEAGWRTHTERSRGTHTEIRGMR